MAALYPGLFTRLADAAPVLIWIAGPDARCVWFNSRWLAFTGRSLEQEVGEGWTHAVHPDDLTGCLTTYRSAFAARAGFEMEYRLQRHDGEYRWIVDRGVPWHTRTGFAGYVGSAVDVTSVKRAEATADAERRRLARIGGALPNVVAYVDADRRHRFGSRAFDDWFGAGRGILEGLPIEEVLGKDAYDAVRPAIARALDGERVEVRLSLPHREGRRDAAVALVPDVVHGGRVEGAVWTIGDLGEGSVAERATRERAAELERLNRAKDEFLAALSHELRTPLNAILGWARIVRSGEIDPERAGRALEVIERNALAQEQLIADLLDMLAVMSGTLRIDPEEVALGALVDRAIESVRLAAENKQIDLAIEAGDDLVMVAADPARLHQILRNVLSNAVKFTPERGRVAVRMVRDGPVVRCEVADTGVGIPPERLSYVFERFGQPEPAGRQRSGLGLGLELARHLAALHGGTLEAASAGPGQGTTLILALPVRAAREDARQGRPGGTDHARAVTPGSAPDPVRGARILVVDDHDDARRLLGVVLRRAGAEVVEAASAPLAIEAFQAHGAQLLVVDLGLPGEDGYGLLRKIRAIEPRVPVIALTGYGTDEERDAALRAGFDAFLAKPVEPARLRRQAADVLRRALAAG